MIHTSNIKVTLDPEGTPYVLLAWGQRTQEIVLPWNQQIDEEPLIGAEHDYFEPRGNTSRNWTLHALVEHADWETKTATAFAREASIPRGKLTLEVRVLDLDADPEGDEESRTLAVYTTEAAIRSMTPSQGTNPLHEWLEWTLKTGAFEEET